MTGHGPQPTDIRLMIPRRSLAAWRRIATTIAPQLAEVGIEPSNQNILAAVLEITDMQMHPDRAVPSMDPNSPFTEWPDGSGMDVAGGYIGGRVDPDKTPTVRGVPIRPSPETAEDGS